VNFAVNGSLDAFRVLARGLPSRGHRGAFWRQFSRGRFSGEFGRKYQWKHPRKAAVPALKWTWHNELGLFLTV